MCAVDMGTAVLHFCNDDSDGPFPFQVPAASSLEGWEVEHEASQHLPENGSPSTCKKKMADWQPIGLVVHCA